MTLAAMRRDAPEGDRDAPALSLHRTPYHPSLGTKFIKAEFRARTLEQLAKWCGLHGPAAVQDARWRAVSVWLMWNPPDIRNTIPVALLSVSLCRDHDRDRLGYPSLTGKPFTSRLSLLSADTAGEARLVAAETLADWEQAGSPNLISSIERTQTYIHAFNRQHLPETEGAAA